MSKVDCIIQARTSSTRLPGKVLKKITKDETVIEFLISQLRFSKFINKLIIATTNLEEDKVIVNFCKDNNIKYFTGDSSNVLKRYFDCAKEFDSENILRVTSDCPLIDPNLVDHGIKMFLDGQYDYVTNSLESSFPHGLDFQIFSFKTLEYVYNNAILDSDKEHVIPFIFNNKDKFKIFNIKNDNNFSNFRITIDWIEDLELIKNIISRIQIRPILMNHVIKLLEENRELIKINSNRLGHNPFLDLQR
jgi:spore coat polysaccharide biosynthesis protein SpsF